HRFCCSSPLPTRKASSACKLPAGSVADLAVGFGATLVWAMAELLHIHARQQPVAKTKGRRDWSILDN
ncbi:MAG: hypothetical protein ACKOAH_11410, partial [Pirellula sp.]